MSTLLWASCLLPNTSSSLNSEAWISEWLLGERAHQDLQQPQVEGAGQFSHPDRAGTYEDRWQWCACPPHLPHAPLSMVWQSPTAPHHPLPAPDTLANPSENSQVIQAHSSYIISLFFFHLTYTCTQVHTTKHTVL